MREMEEKLRDLEEELGMSDKEFEKKLSDRLKDEIKIKKAKLEEDFKKELNDEKKRISQQAVSKLLNNFTLSTGKGKRGLED